MLTEISEISIGIILGMGIMCIVLIVLALIGWCAFNAGYKRAFKNKDKSRPVNTDKLGKYTGDLPITPEPKDKT